MLATVYSASNKTAEAIQQLESIIARNPNDTRTLMGLAVLYEKIRNYQKARDIYEKVLTIAPEFPVALNNLAFIYSERLNQMDRAYQLAQKARSLQPGDGSIADTLGWVLFKRRDYQQALPLLNEAAQKMPNQSEILYHLAMCHYMMGGTDAARTAFDQSLKSPGDFASRGDAQRRLALLNRTQEAGELTIADLEGLVRQQPDDVVARLRLGEQYEARGSVKEAEAQYQETLNLNPKLVGALTHLATLYSDSGKDLPKALEYARNARDLAPGDAHTTLLVGRIAYKAGNYLWAYGVLKQSSDQLNDDAAAHHALGWAAFSVGKVEEATAEMEQVTKLAPASAMARDAKTWLDMMALASAASTRSDAAATISAALKANPDYMPAKVAEGALAARTGDVARAIQVYEQVLTRLPDFAPAQKALAALYALQPATLDKASDLGQKARKTLPNDPDLTRTLAEISFQRKDYGRALSLLEESARTAPLDANHLYYMGICSLQTKDTVQAREALTHALETGLKDPFAADARRALQTIQKN